MLILVCCSIYSNAQSIQNTSFKIVGYYSLKYALTKKPSNAPLNKLTQVNLFFLNPDSTGRFKQNLKSVVPFIKQAHALHVQVLASIGGGGKHSYYAKLLNDSNRNNLISKLVAITAKYNLDGIDVDIEGTDIDSNYEKFVTALATALHQHNKIITAAIAIFFKDSYTDKALAQYDFVDLMSYDHTGAWAPEKPGPHATYEQAVEDLAYFRVVRNMPKEKITLGVPFYGYGFGPKHPLRGLTYNYDHIVHDFPGAEFKDSLETSDSTMIYYNGIPTIKNKVMLAKQDAGGIMIWQLSGDAAGEKSLLTAITETVKENKR